VRYRAFLIPAGGVLLVLVGLIVSFSLNNNFVYYMTPAEAIESRADFPDGRRFRLSGVVVPGSVEPLDSGARFEAIDVEGQTRISVVHTKSPPQLFQENIQVVLEGSWNGQEFHSDFMLIKHDEEYRVPTEGNYLDGDGT
jgi:cytochrome c-type biogenesis protein CcmE